MELIGRITKDAIVKTVKKDNRSLVSFTIAINDYYKPKDADKGIKTTTYVDCSYWLTSSVAKYLLQGTLIELHGRMYATAYLNKNNEPKASIHCHVDSFKLHATTKRESMEESNVDDKNDLPF